MRPAARRLATAFLVLYALLTGGLPLADALLPAVEQSPVAHIEDQSERHHELHDHLSCQLCRAIDRQSAPDADGVAPLDERPRAGADRPAADAAVPAAAPRAALGARAPPTA